MTDDRPTTLDLDRFDAVLFDLDGVITDTASVHVEAWTRMFDAFLRERADARGEPFEPFTYEDYLAHVDGRPRYDGVRTFLASRSIELPEGGPEDSGELETVHGLGNRKNDLVHDLIEEGVEVFQPAVDLVDRLAEAGIGRAVVSSSRNAELVLRAVGIRDRFATVVDGVVAADLGLAGKPAPDGFLEGARRLDVAPARAVVVEDATSGVAAGRAGDFGLVVGVDNGGNAEALRRHGADVVVTSLDQLEVTGG